MYWAVEKGYTNIVRLLLASEPDLELCNKVSSPHCTATPPALSLTCSFACQVIIVTVFTENTHDSDINLNYTVDFSPLKVGCLAPFG